MATLTLEKLTRRHAGEGRPALDRLDLEVKDGELLVLVGPSGCGKSTALRLIAGLDAPDGGRVLIDGRDVTTAAPQDRDVAMVFQGYALYPHLSAADNLAFPLRMRGVPRPERDRRVTEVADLLGITPLLRRKPGELSGGERQRVAMGRAIVRRPKVFLFDEPLANLDAALRAELRVELAALVRRLGTTSIYVTHDQAEAMTMGDRICVMSAGRLQQVAPPRTVYESPRNLFVAGFLGAPPMNRVPVTRKGDVYEGPGFKVPAPTAPDLPDRLTLGVRPEHLHLGPTPGQGSATRQFAGAAESGKASSGRVESGAAESGTAESGKAGSGRAESGKTDSGRAESAESESEIGGRSLSPPLPPVSVTGAASLSAKTSALHLVATVVETEPLGAETHVRLSSHDTLFWARAPGFDAPTRGATIEVTIPAHRLHWFDPATGERVELAAVSADGRVPG